MARVWDRCSLTGLWIFRDWVLYPFYSWVIQPWLRWLFGWIWDIFFSSPAEEEEVDVMAPMEDMGAMTEDNAVLNDAQIDTLAEL
mmetsp:Transcript_9694/g.13243  ORF Transcript_9694/g.13243 Transcript_9694/m.13243 type:complete len:85 (-) Transcript_9694:67-321(-)